VLAHERDRGCCDAIKSVKKNDINRSDSDVANAGIVDAVSPSSLRSDVFPSELGRMRVEPPSSGLPG
jgi:hypothetical protein